ncbi:hypothetical protein FISHEDRAFT_77264 [Fistulina hepatica ATCC 64428]|uniref:Uncharacterized protein n=1 Tax=Fistulina hepatica ATCC 64428 TaxID=1128425 RepID=A0A0D7A1M5_9AGAR|nr:hypothetical protein FISHEDRAFT_77264 [Fistulina hepatica ATCC 64428]
MAVVVLIENSPRTTSIWPQLRDDDALNALATRFEAIQAVFIVSDTNLTFTPFHHVWFPSTRDGLREFSFRANPNARLSAGTICDALDSVLRQSQRGSLELVIISSLAPSPSMAGSALENYLPSTSPAWNLLARKLVEVQAGCHLVLDSRDSREDMASYHNLFSETIRLGDQIEASDSNRSSIFTFRTMKHPPSADPAASLVSSPAQVHPLPAPPSVPSTSTGESGPSIVAQLQRMHGLTKKRVYGAKPPSRPPFIKSDTPTREKYKNLPSASGHVSPTPSQSSTPYSHNVRRGVTRARARTVDATQPDEWSAAGPSSRMSSPGAQMSSPPGTRLPLPHVPPSSRSHSPSGIPQGAALPSSLSPVYPHSPGSDFQGYPASPVATYSIGEWRGSPTHAMYPTPAYSEPPQSIYPPQSAYPVPQQSYRGSPEPSYPRTPHSGYQTPSTTYPAYHSQGTHPSFVTYSSPTLPSSEPMMMPLGQPTAEYYYPPTQIRGRTVPIVPSNEPQGAASPERNPSFPGLPSADPSGSSGSSVGRGTMSEIPSTIPQMFRRSNDHGRYSPSADVYGPVQTDVARVGDYTQSAQFISARRVESEAVRPAYVVADLPGPSVRPASPASGTDMGSALPPQASGGESAATTPGSVPRAGGSASDSSSLLGWAG